PRWGERTSQCRRDTESLAEALLHQLGETLPIPNRGVRPAPFAVLDGAVVPAVHVECGFLTNRNDAALLVDPEFQETVAVALTEGVSDYRRFLESGSVRSP
ncbi:MAG: N-acetylmuramoyl-L-alanine amidase, partial [Gemmatimonadetes bacterium]|nr:N-acetylmuramoyl-L-alanine amidase [Gemmatimonadota bacterium]